MVAFVETLSRILFGAAVFAFITYAVASAFFVAYCMIEWRKRRDEEKEKEAETKTEDI